MRSLRALRRPPLLLLLALLLAAWPIAAWPAGAVERSSVLLYDFRATAPNTPPPIAQIVAVLVRDELEKSGRYDASVRNAEEMHIRRAESEEPGNDPTQLPHALRVARSVGARYLVQGVVTAYEAPEAKRPGKLTFRLTVASTETDVSRDVFVTAGMKVPGKGGADAAKVMGPAAKAVASAIMTDAIPSLDRATPADRTQAAQRERTRGEEAAAGGAGSLAVEDLRRAAKLTPEDAATHVELGEALVKQRLAATALLEFRQALALSAATDTPTPEMKALRLRVIRMLGERGLWDEAAAEARRGLEREPDSEPLRMALAEAQVHRGDGTASLETLRLLHRGHEPTEAQWALMADAYALAGDAPRWLDAMVRGTVAGVAEAGQYAAVVRRLDQAFRSLADDATEAERLMLAGQISPTSFGAGASRRRAQAQVVAAYLGRLAFPEEAATSHAARQTAWAGLARAAERAAQFAGSGNYDDLAAARGERLRAIAQLQAPRNR
jgi:tetratricopeptide (TPR) repeat protein